jgi:thiol-disulfide isomerase/thioredoxin
METLDGPEFRLGAYRDKVVFVNIFATWCPPCNKEQPNFVAFAREHAEDTAVIGLDYAEEDNVVRRYRAHYAISYPIAIDRRRTMVPAVVVPGHLALPTTIVFRPGGTLSCAWTGDSDRATLEMERLAALAESDSDRSSGDAPGTVA